MTIREIHNTTSLQHKVTFFLLRFSFLVFVISSCTTTTSTDPLDYPIFTPEPGPIITASPTTASEAASQALQPPYSIWIDPLLISLQNDMLTELELFEPARSISDADISISITGSEPAGTWTYLVVAPFYALQDDLELTDLITFWLTGESVLPDMTHIYLTDNTVEHLSGYWGFPKASIFTVTTSDKLMDLLWYNPGSIAIIPFEAASPGYKILSIDGMFPLDPGFQPNIYGLSFPIYYSSPNVLFQDSGLGYQLSNYDQSKLTSVALTGVTALVRATAAIMEEKGILYPAGDIQEILVSADITHISNEVPFAENCPPPNPAQESLYFCSDDRYIQLLEAVGTDIVELSGDHFGDWGPEAMLHSLDLYHDRDWIIYGGGETLQAGLDPVYLEHNGNKIAFIGCNGKAHDVYATASETNPGASRCDFEWMIPEITRLSEEGYLVIATMQHEEIDSFFSVALQRYDFRRL